MKEDTLQSELDRFVKEGYLSQKETRKKLSTNSYLIDATYSMTGLGIQKVEDYRNTSFRFWFPTIISIIALLVSIFRK